MDVDRPDRYLCIGSTDCRKVTSPLVEWIQPLVLNDLAQIQQWVRVLRARSATEDNSLRETVVAICDDVRVRGDQALLEYTRRWDNPSAQALEVPSTVVDGAVERIKEIGLWDALEDAGSRIAAFHEQHKRTTWLDSSVQGQILGQRVLPLETVGVYVPGGRAAYPSTVLMAGIPARVAGVGHRVLATPPMAETGYPPDATLAAARIAGFDRIFAMGGAQAVAAMAYGTETVPVVDKIVGPGNAYVNAAKRHVFGAVGIDMLAGPSEVGIVGDNQADPASIATEWICQTEHDPDNRALVVVLSEPLAQTILAQLEQQLSDLPRRDIVVESLRRNAHLAVVPDIAAASELMNAYAPEHLHLDIADPWPVLGLFRNAGAILLGPFSTAAHGDYVAGPCHTLPTGGAARYSNPLNTDDFMRKTSLISLSRDQARALAPTAMRIAEFEGLEGHRRSAERVLHEPASSD